MLPEVIKARIKRDRTATSIAVRIPKDLVVSLKEMASLRGMGGHHDLLRTYIGEGLRHDEARFVFNQQGGSGQDSTDPTL